MSNHNIKHIGPTKNYYFNNTNHLFTIKTVPLVKIPNETGPNEKPSKTYNISFFFPFLYILIKNSHSNSAVLSLINVLTVPFCSSCASESNGIKKNAYGKMLNFPEHYTNSLRKNRLCQVHCLLVGELVYRIVPNFRGTKVL